MSIRDRVSDEDWRDITSGERPEVSGRHIDLEPDDGLGPALRDESGRMSEHTRLVRRVLLLERTIRDAKAALMRTPGSWNTQMGEAYRILDALPTPER